MSQDVDLGLAPKSDSAAAHTRAVVEAAFSFFTGPAVERVDLTSGRFNGLFELYSPDVEWLVRVPDWVGHDTYHGHSGMREWFAEWYGAFDRITLEVHRIEVVRTRAATACTQRGQIDTGPPVEWLFGVVDDVADGRITRVELHGSPEAALARLTDPV
jgi:ketosteroid isomerase-like protein